MRLRAALYRARWLAVERLPLPTVAVGDLSVGGTGKTPLAAWIAARCAARGRRPGILLRGYGGDEALVHRRLVPEAIVIANPDRSAGARQALSAGAEVLILDDAFQLLSVGRDLNIATVSAETTDAVPWTLPAGPWREGPGALARADWIVVTRKCVTPAVAAAMADEFAAGHGRRRVSVAHLALDRFEGLESGARHAVAVVGGRRVVAVAGIADPASFGAQLRALDADVDLEAYPDHHAYTSADVERLARLSAAADYVVVTEKDAVKLRGRWPREATEPLVAVLSVHWERNGQQLEQALDAALEPPGVPAP
jgi:tetraacyldisaccharide 4'-kinase